ncbi:glutathione S-transferase 1-like [Littorina saxatilis]|uniref:Uncharacterized protein n=1 Tax=Littorina saxatilis TaxID=31220 RepID=A0AAN9BA97_9CAEN
MPADLKLVYFNLRGRAEFIRLMLAAAGQKYDEQLVSFEEWPKLKPNTPFGSLPYIEYKGKTYGQSTAIGPFLAREFGLYGKTNADGCRIAEVSGLWEDQLTGGLVKSRFGKTDAEKAEAVKKALEEDMPRFFGYYEKFLKENGSSGFIVGKALSMADFYIYDMIDSIVALKSDALKDYPLLQKLKANVEANPKVKAYLASRPKTSF